VRRGLNDFQMGMLLGYDSARAGRNPRWRLMDGSWFVPGNVRRAINRGIRKSSRAARPHRRRRWRRY
jgi:hypothetical protein